MDFFSNNRSGTQDSEIVQLKNDKFVSKTVVVLKVGQRLHLLHLEQIYSSNLIVIWHRMDMNVNVISIKSMARWVSFIYSFISVYLWIVEPKWSDYYVKSHNELIVRIDLIDVRLIIVSWFVQFSGKKKGKLIWAKRNGTNE